MRGEGSASAHLSTSRLSANKRSTSQRYPSICLFHTRGFPYSVHAALASGMPLSRHLAFLRQVCRHDALGRALRRASRARVLASRHRYPLRLDARYLEASPSKKALKGLRDAATYPVGPSTSLPHLSSTHIPTPAPASLSCQSEFGENRLNENELNQNGFKEIPQSELSENTLNENRFSQNRFNENELNQNRFNTNELNQNRFNKNASKENRLNENRLNQDGFNQNPLKQAPRLLRRSDLYSPAIASPHALYVKSHALGHTCTIGLGGSMGSFGETASIFARLFAKMHKNPRLQICKTSPIYLNKAFGYTKQRDFLNTTMTFNTNLGIIEVKRLVFYLERYFGRKRQRSFKNAPRLLDIDIIFYDDRRIRLEGFCVPHIGFSVRESVLVPLCMQFYIGDIHADQNL